MKLNKKVNNHNIINFILLIKENFLFFLFIFIISSLVFFLFFFYFLNRFEVIYKITFKNDYYQNILNNEFLELKEDRINWVYEEVLKSKYYKEIKNNQNEFITDVKLNIINLTYPSKNIKFDSMGGLSAGGVFTRKLELKFVGFNYLKNKINIDNFLIGFFDEIKINTLNSINNKLSSSEKFIYSYDADSLIKDHVTLTLKKLKKEYIFLNDKKLNNVVALKAIFDDSRFNFYLNSILKRLGKIERELYVKNKNIKKTMILSTKFRDIEGIDIDIFSLRKNIDILNKDIKELSHVISAKSLDLKKTRLEYIENEIFALTEFLENFDKQNEYYKKYYIIISDLLDTVDVSRNKILNQMMQSISVIAKENDTFFLEGPVFNNIFKKSKIMIIINILISSFFVTLISLYLRLNFLK